MRFTESVKTRVVLNCSSTELQPTRTLAKSKLD